VLLDEDERSINDGFFLTDPAAHTWFDFPAISQHRHNFNFALNFADGQSKVVYDLNQRNQVGFALILGDFVFDCNRDRDLLGTNQVFRGNTRNLLVNGQWSYTPNSRAFVQTRVFGLRTTFKNTNRDDAILDVPAQGEIGRDHFGACTISELDEAPQVELGTPELRAEGTA
jgi:hypothetical protein